MKIIFPILFASFFLQNCIVQAPVKKEAFYWISTESIPRDTHGRLNGKPAWAAHWQIKPPYDTFVVYTNNDSILMFSSDASKGSFFRKTQINSTKWKPKPDYGNKLFFLGTYTQKDLEGLYASFYVTKDWRNLLQVWYTNPGNISDVLLFSKDSINILQQRGIIIDPKNEQSEPEIPQIAQ